MTGMERYQLMSLLAGSCHVVNAIIFAVLDDGILATGEGTHKEIH